MAFDDAKQKLIFYSRPKLESRLIIEHYIRLSAHPLIISVLETIKHQDSESYFYRIITEKAKCGFRKYLGLVNWAPVTVPVMPIDLCLAYNLFIDRDKKSLYDLALPIV